MSCFSVSRWFRHVMITWSWEVFEYAFGKDNDVLLLSDRSHLLRKTIACGLTTKGPTPRTKLRFSGSTIVRIRKGRRRCQKTAVSVLKSKNKQLAAANKWFCCQIKMNRNKAETWRLRNSLRCTSRAAHACAVEIIPGRQMLSNGKPFLIKCPSAQNGCEMLVP